MQDYILNIRNREIAAESADTTLVRTGVGSDRLILRFFDSEWLDGFGLSCALSVDGYTSEVPIELHGVVGAGWLAEASLVVPTQVLEHAGALGVCVHGEDEDGNRIITAAAQPLSIELEGDAPA